jgi:anti-sigma B factor antagonist
MMSQLFESRQTTEEQLITITVSNITSDVLLCALTGEIDLLTAPQLQEKLTEVLDHAPAHLMLDLTDIKFLESAGLKILLDIHARQHATGYHLALVVGRNRIVTRPLRITELDQTLDLHTERTTALTACQTHPRPNGSQEALP